MILLPRPGQKGEAVHKSTGFSLQPRFWQSGFLLGALHNRIHGAFNLRGDRTQELCLFSSRELAVSPERFMCQVRSQIEFVRPRGSEIYWQRFARAWVRSTERLPLLVAERNPIIDCPDIFNCPPSPLKFGG